MPEDHDGVQGVRSVFAAYCPREGLTRIHPPSSITLRNTPLGIEVALRCRCGERIEVLTGRFPEPALRGAGLADGQAQPEG